MKLILASTSPRRRQLLETLGLALRVLPPDVAEIEDGEPLKVALLNAEAKAQNVFERYGFFDADLIIGADTIVILDQLIFSKPMNSENAQAMLERLSGKTHQVITAVSLIARSGQRKSTQVISEVTFRTLSTHEIKAYVETKECLDKAGAYAVQGAGAALVDTIRGSISNIIGLPLTELLHEAALMLKSP